MAAPSVIHGWTNNSYSSGGLLYGGTYQREAGDFQLGAFRWSGADINVAFSDSAAATWNALTERHHTKSGSTLRGQIQQCKNVAYGTDVNAFATPDANVAERELAIVQIRGLTADPIVNSDNITYFDGASGTVTLPTASPGGAGIVLGVLWVTEDSVTITPADGWTEIPDPLGQRIWLRMIYKVVPATQTHGEAPAWNVSGGTVVAMGTTLALFAADQGSGGGGGGGGGGSSSHVNAFLLAAARGKTNLKVHVWADEPDVALSTPYTGINAQDATDPLGQPAALLQMSPAPAGTSDGDDVIVAVEDPSSSKVSSWRVPGKVVGTTVAPSTALSVNDSRRMYLITPQRATNNQVSDALVQISTWGPNPALSTVSDSNGDTYNGEVRLKRITDPINGGSRKCFEHAIAPYFPAYQNNTFRSEITSLDNNLPGIVPRPGDQFWGWIGINPDANAQSVGDIAVFDLHGGYPTNNPGPSPLSIILGNGSVSIARTWNASYNAAAPLSRDWTYNVPIATAGWTLFFFQIKLHYLPSQNPFLRIWKKMGAGAVEPVLNVNGPIGYNDPNPQVPPKFGAYKWSFNGSDPKCTVRHKGCQIFRDAPPASGEPDLSLQSLLATAELV